MPSTINGIGTKYYGCREVGGDGSYITTEWLVVVHVPVIPIGSYRVLQTGDNKSYVVYNTSQYIVRPVPLNWRQVMNVYLASVGMIVGFLVLCVIGAYAIG